MNGAAICSICQKEPVSFRVRWTEEREYLACTECALEDLRSGAYIEQTSMENSAESQLDRQSKSQNLKSKIE